MVENSGSEWTDETGWFPESEPGLRIGSDDLGGGRFLHGIVGAGRLPSGTVVVANRGSQELLFFDSEGALLRVTGGHGDGPGEFQRLAGFFLCEDILLADDVRRVARIDSAGTHLGYLNLQGGSASGGSRVEGVTEDCGWMVRLQMAQTPPGRTVHRHTYFLVRLDVGGNEADTIVAFPGPELFSVELEGTLQSVLLPFGVAPQWAIGRDRVYLAPGDSFEVRVYDMNGDLERVIRWNAERASLSRRDRGRYEATRRDLIAQNLAHPVLMPPLDHYPLPDEKPAVAGLVVDDEGHIWVRPYPSGAEGSATGGTPLPMAGDPDEDWWVLGPSGRLLGTVSIPGGFMVLAVRESEVLGIYLRQDFTEEARAYAIRKPSR